MADPTVSSYSNKAMTDSAAAITKAREELDAFTTKTDMDEMTMIEYNLAASKYSTMVSLSSGLVKNISDTEKQVANKM